MSTIILSTHGSGGDVLPFLRIGTALHDLGHQVLLMTHAPYARRARQLGLQAKEIDTDEEYQSHLSDAGAAMRDALGGFDAAKMLEFYRRNRFFEINRMEYDTIAEQMVPGDTIVVGRHTSGLATLLAGERLGVPSVWIAMNPTQYGALPISEFTHAEVFAPIINEMRADIGLRPVRNWGRWLRSADVNIGLWPRWYDQAGSPAPAEAELPGFIVTGTSASGPLPPALIELFDSTVQPILVSGTSGRTLHGEFYSAAITAAVATGRPVVVSTPYRENIPDGLADQVLWVESLPFDQILPRFAALIHHGGIGTTATAAAAGIAQVVLAQGFDQPDNGARVARAGLGSWLPAKRWTREAVQAAVDRALTPAGMPQRYKIDTDATLDGICARIEGALATAARPAVPASRASHNALGARPRS